MQQTQRTHDYVEYAVQNGQHGQSVHALATELEKGREECIRLSAHQDENGIE